MNRWHRLGIIASFSWALYGCWHEVDVLSSEENTGWAVAYKHCTAANNALRQQEAAMGKKLSPGDECQKQADEVSKISEVYFYEMVGLEAFAPVALGWIAALVAVFTFRWVRRGDPGLSDDPAKFPAAGFPGCERGRRRDRCSSSPGGRPSGVSSTDQPQ
jgi:hypothetical protein